MHGFGPVPDRENKIVCSPSALIKFIECPSIYEWEYIKKRKKTTAAMELGTAIHEAILEPELFASKYTFHPSNIPDYSADELKAIAKELGLKTSGTKADLAKSIKEVQPEFDCQSLFDPQGKIVLTEEKSLMIQTIVENVKKTLMFSKIIEPATKEQLCYFTDDDTGVVVSFKTDAVLLDRLAIVLDVKTAGDASKRKFERDHKDMGRDIQAALYCQGIEKVFNRKVDHFCWLVVETSAPYRVYEYVPNIAMIENGLARSKRLLAEFKERYLANDWSKREHGLIETTMPHWAFEQNDLREDFY
jgi:exodeoxyribonuclease VIII